MRQKVRRAGEAEQHLLRSPADLLGLEALLASGKRGGDEKLRLIFQGLTDCFQVRTWRSSGSLLCIDLYPGERSSGHMVQSQPKQKKVELPSGPSASAEGLQHRFSYD